MSSTSTYALNQRINGLEAQVNTIIDDLQPYPIGDVARLNIAQDWTAIQTFNVLPESAIVPTTANQLVNKTYADSLVPSPINAVLIDGSQLLLTGIKTFTNLPECSAVPTTNAQLVNKLYVDGLTPATPSLQQVVDVGNGISNFVGGSTASITSTNFSNGRTLQLNADATPTINMVDNNNSSHYTTFDIDTINLSGVSTNWSSIISPAVPTIDEVLGAGDIATSKQQVFVSSMTGIQNTLNNSQVELTDTGSGETATLTRTNLYIQSPITTSQSHTEITNVSIISNTFNNINGDSNTTTIQGGSLLMLDNQPLTSTSQQLQITPTDVYLSTNAGIPTTASWASILAGGGATPTISQVLTQGNDANALLIANVGQITMSDIATSLSSASLAFNNNNGAITGLQTINGSPYPPSATQSLSNVLGYGNDAGNQTIINVNQLLCNDSATYLQSAVLNFSNNNGSISGVSTINGGSYPPYPTSPYGLNSVLAIDNNGGGYSMTGIDNINLNSINGSSYPPSYSVPDLNNVLNQGNSAYHDIDMTTNNINNCGNLTVSTINSSPYTISKPTYSYYSAGVSTVYNGGTTIGGTGIPLPVGNYQITYSIAWDSQMYSSNPLSSSAEYCNCYCFLHSYSYGDQYTVMKNNGYNPSILLTTNGSYQNSFTLTDTIVIYQSDTYYLGVGQSNSVGAFASAWISATLILQ